MKASPKKVARIAVESSRWRTEARVHHLTEYPPITFDEIKELMHKPHGPSIIRTITPGVAGDILHNETGLNANNRPKKKGKIADFANDMLRSQWKLTGDTIKFSDKKFLRDGQNRLEASVLSKKSFVTHIVFGIDDAVFTFLDRGKPRTNADAFVIARVPNAATVAGAMWWLEKFRSGNPKDRSSVNPYDALEAYKKHYDKRLMKKAVAAGRKVAKNAGEQKAVAVTLYYLFAEKDEGLADQFFEAWATRNFAGGMGPIKKASEYLVGLQKKQQEARHAPTFRLRELARMAAWIAAWNLIVHKQQGKGTTPFVYHSSLPFPTIEAPPL